MITTKDVVPKMRGNVQSLFEIISPLGVGVRFDPKAHEKARRYFVDTAVRLQCDLDVGKTLFHLNARGSVFTSAIVGAMNSFSARFDRFDIIFRYALKRIILRVNRSSEVE